jgi:hypothetical protein
MCNHQNFHGKTGYHVFQKGNREEICFYGTQKVCKECGWEGTIQDGGFVILPEPVIKRRAKCLRKKKQV